MPPCTASSSPGAPRPPHPGVLRTPRPGGQEAGIFGDAFVDIFKSPFVRAGDLHDAFTGENGGAGAFVDKYLPVRPAYRLYRAESMLRQQGCDALADLYAEAAEENDPADRPRRNRRPDGMVRSRGRAGRGTSVTTRVTLSSSQSRSTITGITYRTHRFATAAPPFTSRGSAARYRDCAHPEEQRPKHHPRTRLWPLRGTQAARQGLKINSLPL